MPEIQSTDRKRKDFHPLADIFPLMTEAEFGELVSSIKLNGLREPISLFEHKILDGSNRALACEAAGVKPRFTSFAGGDPTAFVIDKNIRRRHLTQEQKREFADKLLQANPERSDRQIAELIRADHKTVATVRKEKEGRGEIPHVEVRTDAAGRKQPVRKVRTGPRRQRARQDRAGGDIFWMFVAGFLDRPLTRTLGSSPRRSRSRRRWVTSMPSSAHGIKPTTKSDASLCWPARSKS
jgi:hypothetical protein